MEERSDKSVDKAAVDRRSFLSVALSTCAITPLAPLSLQLATSLAGSLTKEQRDSMTPSQVIDQLAAALGNLLTVALGAIVFAVIWSRLFAEPYLGASSARYVYESLNPLASGTGRYAALTGVVLWISALAGGWVENFATYKRVGEAIAGHPLGRRGAAFRKR